jgi:hypothetical protein
MVARALRSAGNSVTRASIGLAALRQAGSVSVDAHRLSSLNIQRFAAKPVFMGMGIK